MLGFLSITILLCCSINSACTGFTKLKRGTECKLNTNNHGNLYLVRALLCQIKEYGSTEYGLTFLVPIPRCLQMSGRFFCWGRHTERRKAREKAITTNLYHIQIYTQGLAQITPSFYYKIIRMYFCNITVSHSSAPYDILCEMFNCCPPQARHSHTLPTTPKQALLLPDLDLAINIYL